MNVRTEQAGSVSIVRVGETRVTYPMLGEFNAAVAAVVAAGSHNVLIDLAQVSYIDSATIGCLMDLYRQTSGAGGRLKLSGVQRRVQTMLTMTGTQNFIEIHEDEGEALKSFGA